MPTQKIDVHPYFDMELFLQSAEEHHISGQEMDELADLWESWLPSLQAVHLTDQNCLAVWLDKSVEDAVDGVWALSPTKGFRHNALAQTLCMCAVHALIPEVEDEGCAPAPAFSTELAKTLNTAGLPCPEFSFTLGRRYAVLTPYPFKGGCDICSLGESCPRKNQDSNFAFVLPGFEEE